MLQIQVQITRTEIDIRDADYQQEDFPLVDDLQRRWPFPRKVVARAVRDAHLGRQERLTKLLLRREMGGLVTETGTLVRDWHEQLQEWAKR